MDQMFAKKASHLKQPPLVSTKPSQELYEVIEEPTNEAEKNLDFEEPSLMPYAIHEFPDESLTDQRSSSVTVNKAGPKVPNKSHFSRNKKISKDPNIRRSRSESGRDDLQRVIKPAKPPVSKKGHIAMKPPLKGTASNSPVPDAGAYSELDKKTSYATLEPHMGDKKEEFSDAIMKESYCHLNH